MAFLSKVKNIKVEASTKITIDLDAIAAKMLSYDIDVSKASLDHLPEGWTNSIVDSLSDLYDLETKLMAILKNKK